MRASLVFPIPGPRVPVWHVRVVNSGQLHCVGVALASYENLITGVQDVSMPLLRGRNSGFGSGTVVPRTREEFVLHPDDAYCTKAICKRMSSEQETTGASSLVLLVISGVLCGIPVLGLCLSCLIAPRKTLSGPQESYRRVLYTSLSVTGAGLCSWDWIFYIVPSHLSSVPLCRFLR